MKKYIVNVYSKIDGRFLFSAALFDTLTEAIDHKDNCYDRQTPYTKHVDFKVEEIDEPWHDSGVRIEP